MSAKHQIIYDEIVGGISSGQYPAGYRMPTECELASRFDVSRQTVLKALNTLKSQGVLVGYQGKGTFVAEKIRQNRASTRQIAFVCSNLQDSFAHRAIIGIEAELSRADYSLITCNTANNVEKESQFLRRLQQQNIDGVILIPYQPTVSRELVRELTTAAEPLHIVCIDRGYDNTAIPVVHTNNYTATREGIAYLTKQGHRRIGFITNTIDSLSNNRVINERYQGYLAALKDHGIEFQANWVQELGGNLAQRRPRDVGLDLYGYMPMHRLLSLAEPPTAVFLLWDELAPGAVAAINNSGLSCPKDISLLGFNDDDLCTLMTPQLSTIRQPAEEMGRKAVELILKKINGETAEDAIMENRLIIRASIANNKE